MLTVDSIQARIVASFPDAVVKVQDLTGGGDHWNVMVVSEAFAGKRLVQQHKMIYGVFSAELADGSLHALALKTMTPDQYQP